MSVCLQFEEESIIIQFTHTLHTHHLIFTVLSYMAKHCRYEKQKWPPNPTHTHTRHLFLPSQLVQYGLSDPPRALDAPCEEGGGESEAAWRGQSSVSWRSNWSQMSQNRRGGGSWAMPSSSLILRERGGQGGEWEGRMMGGAGKVGSDIPLCLHHL